MQDGSQGFGGFLWGGQAGRGMIRLLLLAVIPFPQKGTVMPGRAKQGLFFFFLMGIKHFQYDFLILNMLPGSRFHDSKILAAAHFAACSPPSECYLVDPKDPKDWQ